MTDKNLCEEALQFLAKVFSELGLQVNDSNRQD
jgi:hypothetical protein